MIDVLQMEYIFPLNHKNSFKAGWMLPRPPSQTMEKLSVR